MFNKFNKKKNFLHQICRRLSMDYMRDSSIAWIDIVSTYLNSNEGVICIDYIHTDFPFAPFKTCVHLFDEIANKFLKQIFDNFLLVSFVQIQNKYKCRIYIQKSVLRIMLSKLYCSVGDSSHLPYITYSVEISSITLIFHACNYTVTCSNDNVNISIW